MAISRTTAGRRTFVSGSSICRPTPVEAASQYAKVRSAAISVEAEEAPVSLAATLMAVAAKRADAIDACPKDARGRPYPAIIDAVVAPAALIAISRKKLRDGTIWKPVSETERAVKPVANAVKDFGKVTSGSG